MGAEGSRMYSPSYDSDEFFYRGYIQGAPIVPDGTPTEEPATSTIVDIYHALGSDINAISKLAAIHVSPLKPLIIYIMLLSLEHIVANKLEALVFV